MCSHSDRRPCGSRPVVGSSRKISSGSLTSASAIDSRCRWPPERSLLRAVARSPSPRSSISRSCRPAARVEGAEERDQLADGQLRVQGCRLQLDADSLLERARVAHDVDAQHLGAARIGRAQALEDLDRRRLAGAVGAEQAEDLAAVDAEGDAVYGVQLSVGLAQLVDGDDRAVGRGGGTAPILPCAAACVRGVHHLVAGKSAVPRVCHVCRGRAVAAALADATRWPDGRAEPRRLL
jgi:hypothetical protein